MEEAMAVRTVRLDDETEDVLRRLMKQTGLSVSQALKRGLLALRNETTRQARRPAYEIYRRLDLGPGGYAIAPASKTRAGVVEAIRRKHRR
jgi:hypothetical protein